VQAGQIKKIGEWGPGVKRTLGGGRPATSTTEVKIVHVGVMQGYPLEGGPSLGGNVNNKSPQPWEKGKKGLTLG